MEIFAGQSISSVQFSSVALSCLTLCDPMNCSTDRSKTSGSVCVPLFVRLASPTAKKPV